MSVAAASCIRPKRSDQTAVTTKVDRDRQLVEALRRREPAAAECLVAKYGDRAYRLATGIAGNSQDAEEVVQDAFWTVVRKIDTFRGESAFGSWFYRIVANAAYQRLRRWPGRRSEIPLDEVLPLFHENGQHAAPIADWSRSVEDPSHQTDLRGPACFSENASGASCQPRRLASRLHLRSNGSSFLSRRTERRSPAIASHRLLIFEQAV